MSDSIATLPNALTQKEGIVRFLSQVYTIARGSVGGLTYTANQFHQLICRARTAPVQPNTIPQTWIRSSMTDASDRWNNLTQIQRDSWEIYGDNTQWPGPLGPHTIPGRQCAIAGLALRAYILATGLAAPTGVDTAPAPLDGFYNLKNVGPTTFTLPADTGISVSFSSESLVDCAVLLLVSGPMNPARKRHKGPWDPNLTKASVVSAGTSSKIDVGGLIAGARYFWKLRAVADDAPARVSPAFYGSAFPDTNP